MDRGPQFVAEFTKEIYRLLGIKLAATTAYHPQGDRQTERVNQELEQFLRLFINQWLSGDVIELLIYHQPSVKPSLTLHPFGVLGYVAGHSLTAAR